MGSSEASGTKDTPGNRDTRCGGGHRRFRAGARRASGSENARAPPVTGSAARGLSVPNCALFFR
ncbi:MAG TPA: hypothetical protein PKW41_10335 [Clostridia bacterium]|nr:hypothetical protein [Clostridia bacterium]HPK16383.1 hypothetical protein [Clostridia bacterium]